MTQSRKQRKISASQGTGQTKTDIAALQAVFDELFPDHRLSAVLELLSHTGVADQGQILTDTGLTRHQFSKLCDHCRRLAGDEIFFRAPIDVPRPGSRGRPRAVYVLGGIGAALLRANGYLDAHPCGLTDAKSIAHARAVLDVRLSGQTAGLHVQTERELPYTNAEGMQAALRPDNLVTYPDGTRVIFELEQDADITLLRRIVASLRNKSSFFLSAAAATVSSTVRVLVNLTHGPAWDKTVAVWERAAAIVAEEHNGGDLPFHILALPLPEFLAAPDWFEPPDPTRWESLFDPAQTAAFGPTVPSKRHDKSKGKAVAPMRTARLPQKLENRSHADDRRILQAYWQHLLEHGPELAYAGALRLDPAFFEVMQVIHVASYPLDASPIQQATYPYASIYLLRTYLQMHPRLREALSKAIARGSGTVRWSVATIQHRIQVVIQRFLRYHGGQVSRTLQAIPVPAWNRDDSCQDFGVMVRLHPELLMGESDEVVPGREEVEAAEKALAWVLWALFAYGEDLGLRQAVFW
jgi:hypothetical protein